MKKRRPLVVLQAATDGGEMTNSLIALGTAGWMPTSTRETSCYALETPELVVFFDLGTGISRLASKEGQKMLAGHDQVLVLLSHYHLDHLAGLFYLPRFLEGKQVTIAGPGRQIYGRSAEAILTQLCSRPFFALSLTEFPMKLTFTDLHPGANSILGLDIQTRLQEHPDPSLGFRVLNVAYVTDTPCAAESISLVEHCSILVHEAMLDAAGAIAAKSLGERVHSDAISVAKLATDASVKCLVLTHTNPAYSDSRLAHMLKSAQQIFARTFLASDLMVFSI
jgi:ribonuclease BN (tRNA processing enzyme)